MKRLILLLMIVGLVGSAGAASSTNWARPVASGVGNWNNVANWDPFVPAGTETGTDPCGNPIYSTEDNGGLPGPGYVSRVKDLGLADIVVNTAEIYGKAIRHGYYEDGSGANTSGTTAPLLTIQNGGSLAYSNGTESATHSYIGHWSNAQMDIEFGGSFTGGKRLQIGYGPGATGTINVSGTLTNTLNNVFVGVDGVGLLTIEDGGVLNLKNSNNGLQISGTSWLDLEGSGMIVVVGDYTGSADADILGGRMRGDGIVGNLIAVFDGTYTTVTVIPEPATMILLGLGSILLRKRR